MLAHLKSKRREETSNTSPMLQDSGVSVEEQGHPNSCMSGQSLPNCPANPRSLQQFTNVPPRIDECPTTRLTCDALCSLSNSVSQLMQHGIPNDCDSSEEKRCTKKISMGCPKQEHQLPMFLSSKSRIALFKAGTIHDVESYCTNSLIMLVMGCMNS